MNVIEATLRTNYYTDPAALAFKLMPGKIDGAPFPRPKYEIWVCSPRVEGVHLRFGEVARGGLRWSDRRDDFRTEVLGLVKAQMVKNAVIVPTGAKGGFFAKQLPNPAVDRGAWMEEGKSAYRIFIRSLLEITDNLVTDANGETVVPPANVVRLDGDDTYLVVAADKGTASFSDIANSISEERGHWLGDAFASGGSIGYDHKAMGITARGAWESVKRHFAEFGVDTQTEEFTAAGVGDMSGDVFGNGLLRTRTVKLVAAFDHRDIFLDPNPDAGASFDERARLFELPRSSWADYNKDLISAGGGVFSRSLKSIPISPEVRDALGLGATVSSMAPTELLKAILGAPVDLLYNGGIGTYVKASTETHAEVGDRANDAIRVDGKQIRAKVIGEGGNLGMTQLGRIEAALHGVLLNTDAIDNSAGVDCSDHEVNIKIFVDRMVRAGKIDKDERVPIPALDDRRGLPPGAEDQLRPERDAAQRQAGDGQLVPGLRAPDGLAGGARGPEPRARVPAHQRAARGTPGRGPDADRAGTLRAGRLREDPAGVRACRVRPAGRPVLRGHPAQLLPGPAGRTLRRGTRFAPAAPRDHRHGDRQRHGQRRRHHLRLPRHGGNRRHRVPGRQGLRRAARHLRLRRGIRRDQRAGTVLRHADLVPPAPGHAPPAGPRHPLVHPPRRPRRAGQRFRARRSPRPSRPCARWSARCCAVRTMHA